MLKKAAGIDKGTGTPGREKKGKISMAQIEKVASDKMADLNTTDLEAAKRMVAGTARSMGLEVTE
jgi:large subunit ribosomal protein L11